MFKKIILILLFFQLIILLFPQTIPQPKNNQLYTEFVSYRTALYLKKPIVSRGYIAMDGVEKFIFKQSCPVLVEIRKSNNLITYKRGDSEPIQVDFVSDNIFFIFGESEKIKEKYNVIQNDNKNKYYLTPKEKESIKQIIITAIDDIISKIEILFNDKTELVYEFKNTITGIKPDEKYF